MEKKIYQNYLLNLIPIVKKQAYEAKTEANTPREKTEDDISQGVLMGYYSIITLFKHEAFTFCIDQKEIGLAEIKPDIDLLCMGSPPNRNPDVDCVEDNWAIDEMTEQRVMWYLSDLNVLLQERAMEAKKDADAPKEGFESYNKGELLAYHRVFSTMQKQASLFDLNQEEIRLSDIDPDRDLVV